MLRVALTRYLTGNRIGDGAVQKIVLCADEALINAVQHAPEGLIHVAAEVSGDRFVLEVVDDGPGFDLSDLDDAPLPDLMGEHGRGLFLIRQLMDELEILPDTSGTTLRMALGLGAG
jgi:anti-sigma regulatory factor (Ser/Thr protein kinase)